MDFYGKKKKRNTKLARVKMERSALMDFYGKFLSVQSKLLHPKPFMKKGKNTSRNSQLVM
jgi:hypothetical protein